VSAVAPLEYEVVAHSRAGSERIHRYASESRLEPGRVIRLEGRYWLIERVQHDSEPPRALARPARYRIRLRHPDDSEELGALRRYRPDAPQLGHSFTTVEDGQPVSWAIVEEGLARDDQDEPYIDLLAKRDYAELEQLPDHELEHALASRGQSSPAEATELLARAGSADLSVELVALEPGELPDWEASREYIGALTLVEIEDDLLELCGVAPDRDPRETWLQTVTERLLADLESVRADVEGDHDEIEVWEFLDGRVFAAVGDFDDEADPDSGYGWLSRLVDAGALAAARFHRVRKPELQLSE